MQDIIVIKLWRLSNKLWKINKFYLFWQKLGTHLSFNVF